MNAAMNAAERQIVGKVDITYSSKTVDPSITYDSSEYQEKSNRDQIANGSSSPTYKWFSFRENKLDGSCHFIPANKSEAYEVGWWGRQISALNGSFAVPIHLYVLFNARAIDTLSVVGDSLLNNYPVDFDINLYGTGDSLLYSEEVRNHNQYNYVKQIDNVFNVVKMELIIYKINKPNVTAKIIEFYRSVSESYGMEDIISIDLLEELHYETQGIPLGAVSSNEVDIVLDNFSNKFTPGNPDSIIQTYLKKNRLVKPAIGVVEGNGVLWCELGTFWSVDWNVKEDSKTVVLTARDRLEQLRSTDFTTSETYVNHTLYQLFEIILQDAGLSSGEYSIDQRLKNFILPYAWFPKMSHRDALQRLASCSIANVYCNRQNKIIVGDIQPTKNATILYDDDVNVIEKKFPTQQLHVTNYVEVTAQALVTKSENVYSINKPVVIPARQSVSLTCLFSKTPVVSLDEFTIVGAEDIEVTVDNTYCWYGVIAITNNSTFDQTITELSITGTTLANGEAVIMTAEDPNGIAQDGKLKSEVAHELIQTENYAQYLATELLGLYTSSRQDVQLDTRGDATILLGDKTQVKDSKSNVITEYMLTRQNLSFDGSMHIQVEGKFLNPEYNKTYNGLSRYTHNQLEAYTYDQMEGGI